MGAIKLLPEGVWARIAAGEVVERPASAVKEMVENSLDAGAKRIRVKLWDGGRVRIAVEDDGAGIEFDELPLALTPHATSKIGGVEDLESIRTLGYRGEALASLAAVSKVEIRSKTKDGGGGMIKAYEGRVTDHAEVNCTPGTRVQADEIFANLPARRKFLKSASGELRRVAAILRDYAICRPEVAFALEHDARTVFSTDGAGTRRRAIEQLWGSEPAVHSVDAAAGRVKLECWWQHRPAVGRNDVSAFVNGRSVSDPVIKGAVSAAARELAGGWALFFSVDPSLVDVNIHPAKAEIRFRYPGEVFEAVKDAAAKLNGSASINIGIEHRIERGIERPFEKKVPPPAGRDGGGWDFKADFSAGGSMRNSAASSFRTSSYQARIPEKDIFQSAFSRVEAPEFSFETEDVPDIRDSQGAEPPERGFGQSPDAEYIGRLTAGYLVFDSPDGLAVVDPHAAHERVVYERIRAAASEGKRSQPLLMPSPVPPTLQLEVEDARDILEGMGFGFETVGGGTRLTAVPYIAGAALSPDAMLRSSAAALREEGGADMTELLWRTWATMACKEAVKVTDKLMPEEAEALWKELHGCEQPLVCPHGRPTVLTLPVSDLRKYFGRE